MCPVVVATDLLTPSSRVRAPRRGTVGERVVGSAAQSGWGIGAVHGWRAEPLCNWSSATLLTRGFVRWWGHVPGVAGAPATSGGCPHCQRVNSRSGSEGSVWMMMDRFIRRRSVSYTHLRAHETVLDLV